MKKEKFLIPWRFCSWAHCAGPQLLARGPSGLLTCPSRPSGAQAKGHTHRTLTIYDALAIADAAEISLLTKKRTRQF